VADLTWHDGTVTFVDEQKGTLDCRVSLDRPGLVLYAVAHGMVYAVPTERVIEVTLDLDAFAAAP
jgi:hypothetical protein